MAIDTLVAADLSKYGESKAIPQLEVRNPPILLQDTEAGRLLEQYGRLDNYDIPSGGRATILPSFSVPLSYLDRSNWVKVMPMGNFRDVKAVRVSDDVTKPAIVSKSPERVFTTDTRKLDKGGNPWWGGRRSGEKPIFIGSNAVVEEQTVWEAIILLELRKQDIRAEIPQALIYNYDGRVELIVKEISSPRVYGETRGPSWSEIFERITEIGLIPIDSVDSGGHNWLKDEDEYIRLIDVNRWVWSSYTDNYRARLLSEVTTAISATADTASFQLV